MSDLTLAGAEEAFLAANTAAMDAMKRTQAIQRLQRDAIRRQIEAELAGDTVLIVSTSAHVDRVEHVLHAAVRRQVELEVTSDKARAAYEVAFHAAAGTQVPA